SNAARVSGEREKPQMLGAPGPANTVGLTAVDFHVVPSPVKKGSPRSCLCSRGYTFHPVSLTPRRCSGGSHSQLQDWSSPGLTSRTDVPVQALGGAEGGFSPVKRPAWGRPSSFTAQLSWTPRCPWPCRVLGRETLLLRTLPGPSPPSMRS
ncbi:hypothetical protein H1C71_021123, partial [Ictidomys tridecemlineatus]